MVGGVSGLGFADVVVCPGETCEIRGRCSASVFVRGWRLEVIRREYFSRKTWRRKGDEPNDQKRTSDERCAPNSAVLHLFRLSSALTWISSHGSYLLFIHNTSTNAHLQSTLHQPLCLQTPQTSTSLSYLYPPTNILPYLFLFTLLTFNRKRSA